MKPLIVMLLFAIAAESQTLADLARQERARKAALKSVHVFTTEDAKGTATSPATLAASEPAVSTSPAPTPAPTPAAPVAAPAAVPAAAPDAARQAAEDAARKYADQLANLRATVIQLQDQDVALQLQINALKNQFLSPVTDTTVRAQVQAKLDQVQVQLAMTQRELTDTRRAIQVLEAEGPPKPQ